MIIDLPDTTTSGISKTLVRLRDEGGSVALGRVLTLIIVTAPDREESSIDAANAASREHPMRVIVLTRVSTRAGDAARIDAQIRVGGDAGASEVIVIRGRGAAADDEESLVTGLLLPDAPVVVWWSGDAPDTVRDQPLGRIAQRRITDAAAHRDVDVALARLRAGHTPGDTDLAWTRTTLWRSQLASVLDQPPYSPVTSVLVTGDANSPSLRLLASWLGLQLECPASIRHEPTEGIAAVELERAEGTVRITRLSGQTVRLEQPGQPTHEVAVPRRTDRECLAEELRRLDPDEVYAAVVRHGLDVPVVEEGIR